METIRFSGDFVGPGIGGWLVTVLGAPNVVAVQVVAFIVSAVSLLAIRTHEPAHQPVTERPRLRTQIR